MRKVWNRIIQQCITRTTVDQPRYVTQTYHVDRMPEIMFDAPTNAGQHVILNVACGCSQQYTNGPVFGLSK